MLSYPELVDKLEDSFRTGCEVPNRLHYNYESGQGDEHSSLLLMPAWKHKLYVGLKILAISPYNSLRNLATIQGIYTLMDAKDGRVLAQFDAKSLTNLRTAASSALASKFLSKKDSAALLMIGTGALAPEMIKAHCAMRSIRKVWIWGRNFEKAKSLAEQLTIDQVAIEPVRRFDDCLADADIISTATSSKEPLILGNQLKAGQHIDLVGAFKPTWREADDEVIARSSVFVDTREGALRESGELLIPIEKGKFSSEDICGDLFDLCTNGHNGRECETEITSFISVGYALEDLAAAELVWEKYKFDTNE